MTQAIRDQNFVTVALGQSNTDSTIPLPFLIDSSTGRLLVDASSSGSTGYQVATGTVNGTNKVFTFSVAPNAIVVDGVSLRKVASDGTVNWTGTTAITLLVAPNFDIYAVA